MARRRKTLKLGKKPPVCVTFNDGAEMREFINSRQPLSTWGSESIECSSDERLKRFAGRTIVDQLAALTCDEETAEKIVAAGDIQPLPTEPTNMLEGHVSGCVPNVGAAIKGLPKTMFRVVKKPRTESILNLAVNMIISSDISLDAACGAALKIASLIVRLEQLNVRCALCVYSAIRGWGERDVLIRVRLKEAHEPLDLLACAGILAHPAFPRLSCLSVMERVCDYVECHGGLLSDADTIKTFPDMQDYYRMSLYDVITYDQSLDELVSDVNDYLAHLCYDRYEN